MNSDNKEKPNYTNCSENNPPPTPDRKSPAAATQTDRKLPPSTNLESHGTPVYSPNFLSNFKYGINIHLHVVR